MNVWLIGTLSLVGFASLPSLRGPENKTVEVATSVLTSQAVRGRLDIILAERGRLDSANNSTAFSQCEWSARLLQLAPEGQWVEEGEVIALLDSSELQERLREREIALIQAESDLALARESLQMQELENESGIARSQLQQTLAELDLTKYEDGEYERDRKDAESKMALAEEDYRRAEKYFEYVERLASKGYQSAMAVEQERLKVLRYRDAFETAKGKLHVLETYEHPRKMLELRWLAEESVRESARVEKRAAVALLNRQIRARAQETRRDAALAYVERLRQNIAACEIRAPQSGELVYANDGPSSNDEIEVGETVRFQQAVARIPDFTRMEVKVHVHESRINGVEEGLPASIRIDAFPGRALRGHIHSVARIPARGQYPNYDLREYETIVRVDARPDELDGLKPGLTAQVDIHIARVDDCLHVPIQSLVEVAGEPIVFVKTPAGLEHRHVRTGLANETHVEIQSGLLEGDSVLLSPRTSCSDLLIALEQEHQSSEVQPANIGG